MENTVLTGVDSHVTGFLNGSSDHAYSFLGAHPAQQDGESGWLFRVWAPKAKAVAVMGSFNNWSETADQMSPLAGGIWELFLPGLQVYDSYKYAIHTLDGQVLAKADPYAFHAETRPATASKLYDLSGYQWSDQAWLQYRRQHSANQRPLNIYEVHLGSWRRTGDGRFLSYRETAKWLVPYVKEMGFTAVEFLPVMEHSQDESWGYQCTGYFAPTSRFGTPKDFMYLIDQLHQAGVAVLLDWVPAHFPLDDCGLVRFDGTPCYEYANPSKASLPSWGTRAFDFGRSEVWSFLTSSALFWLREYHADGLRLDDVASMLYLDYDGRPWQPNRLGGLENLEAVAFLRHLNGTVAKAFPEVLMIAEESSAWAHVTGSAETSPTALGFRFKWDLGWSHNILHYLKLDPIYRQYNHKDLTFSLTYSGSEQHILPFSHNEITDQKNSLIGRMWGDDAMKFSGVRAFYLYMLTHPGKKLLMMGTEFGQFNPWNSAYSLDWHLLEYQPFRQHQDYFRAANQFYLASPPLWEMDGSKDGFRWVCAEDAGGNTLIYLRRDSAGKELLVAINFSPMGRLGYRVGVPDAGLYQVVFHTDSTDHGGCGRVGGQPVHSVPISCHHCSDSILVDLPPMTGLVLQCVRKEQWRPKSGGRRRRTS